MIVEMIAIVFMSTIKILFGWLPNIPPMPQMLQNAGDWFIQFSEVGTGVLIYLVSPPIYVLIIGLVIFMTTFDYIYHFAIRFLIFRLFMSAIGR